jgi:hypothetical protein
MYSIAEALAWTIANWEWPAGVLLGVLIALCATFLTGSLVRKAFIALDSWFVPNSSTTGRVMVKQATDDFYACVEVPGKSNLPDSIWPDAGTPIGAVSQHGVIINRGSGTSGLNNEQP